MAMGECSAYSSLYRRTQRSSLLLGLRVSGHLALTDFRPHDPSELLHMAGPINIALGIIIVIIKILLQ